MTTTRRSFLVGGAALWGAACATTPEAKPPAAHPLEGLADFAGNPLPLPAILGNVMLLDFWAGWCAPCRTAFPHLDQLYQTYQPFGLHMLAVSVDDDPGVGKRLWAAVRPHFPVAWDETGGIRERFAVAQLPTTILLDQNGMIAQRNEGFDPVDHRLLEEHVRRLLR